MNELTPLAGAATSTEASWRQRIPQRDDPELPTIGLDSPWDPAYLLALRYAKLDLATQPLPTLGSVEASKLRLNQLVGDKHKKITLHTWVNDAAERLNQAGYNIGIGYSIVGSAARQVLGCEWLQEVLHNYEEKHGCQLGELMAWVSGLHFTRNDIDARIYVSLGKQHLGTAMHEIAALFESQPDVQVQKQWAGNAVLIKRAHWDLYIPLKSQRRHIFDADACEIRIPYKLKNSDPWLDAACDAAMVRSLCFETLDSTSLEQLNGHMWRAMLYQGVRGRRVARYETYQAIYAESKGSAVWDLKYQVEKSCAEHGMPQDSTARHLFLLQVLCDHQDRADLARSQLLGSRVSVWSQALRLKDTRQLQAGLMWLALLALKENWRAPFHVRLAERAGQACLRINCDKQTLWLALDRDLLHSCDCLDAWPLIKALDWDAVDCQPTPPHYSSELKVVLQHYVGELPCKSAFQRFLRWRWLHAGRPEGMQLDWHALSCSEAQLEANMARQARKLKAEFWIREVLSLPRSLVSEHELNTLVLWRIEQGQAQAARPLEAHWLGERPWRLLLKKSYDRRPLAKWALLHSAHALRQIDAGLREELVAALDSKDLELPLQLAVYEHLEADRRSWERLYHRKDLIEHAELLIDTALSQGRIGDAQRICLKAVKARKAQGASIRLLERLIEMDLARQALAVWSALRAEKRLQDWNKDWDLLLILDSGEDPEFAALIERCAAIGCPDLQRWHEQATRLRASWDCRSSASMALLALLIPTHPEFFPLYLEHKPPLEEARARWPAQLDEQLLTASLRRYMPLLVEQASVCPQELERVSLVLDDALEQANQRGKSAELLPTLRAFMDSCVQREQLPSSLVDFEAWLRLYPNLRFLWLQRFDRAAFRLWAELQPLAPKIEQADYSRCIRQVLPWLAFHGTDCVKLLQEAKVFKQQSLGPQVLDLASKDAAASCVIFACEDRQGWIDATFAQIEQSSDMKKQLRLTKQLLAWSLDPQAQPSAIQKLQRLVPRAVGICSRAREISHAEAFMCVLQSAAMRGCALERLEQAFTLIMLSAPAKLNMQQSRHRHFLLLAAQSCHLMLHGIWHERATRRVCCQRAWTRLLEIYHGGRVAHKHMGRVQGTVDFSSCPKQNPPAELLKTMLLLDPGSWSFPGATNRQVFVAAGELSLWVGQQVQEAPALRSWMLRWVDSVAETAGYALNDQGIGRAYSAMAQFFMSELEPKSEECYQLCRTMILRWGQLRTSFIQEVWLKTIVDGLERLEDARLINLLKLHLRERCLEHQEAFQRLSQWLDDHPEDFRPVSRVDYRQDERHASEDSGTMLNFNSRLNKCLKIAYVGCGAMTAGPLAHAVNTMAGQRLPGFSLVADHSLRAGLTLVGLGSAGMMLMVVLTIGTIIREVFRGR